MKNSLGEWRSPLASVFASNAKWKEIGDSQIVESFAEEVVAPPAGMCDLSPLHRSGAKGEFSAAAPPPNISAPLANGALCCRLSADEIFILASPSGVFSEADKKIMPSARIQIPRRDSHCQIGLFGEKAEDVLARVCALPPPRENELQQTRVAEVSAIVVSEPRAAGRALYLLTESGYAMHLWEAVHSVVQKLGGGVVGWKQWRDLFPAAVAKPKKAAAKRDSSPARKSAAKSAAKSENKSANKSAAANASAAENSGGESEE